MSDSEIPDRIKSFLFHCIDSAEQLEILLILSSDKSKCWSVQALSDELRSTPGSVDRRLTGLKNWNLVQATDDAPPCYSFSPSGAETEQLVHELSDIYRIKKHRILELLFSSMRKAKFFADAFRLSTSKGKKDEDDHG